MGEVRTSLVSDTTGTKPASLNKQWATRAFVNLNGTGTISIESSGNVVGLTDGGTGETLISWTNSFDAITYACTAGATPNFGAVGPSISLHCNSGLLSRPPEVGSVSMQIRQSSNGTLYDARYVNLMAIGDLA